MQRKAGACRGDDSLQRWLRPSLCHALFCQLTEPTHRQHRHHKLDTKNLSGSATCSRTRKNAECCWMSDSRMLLMTSASPPGTNVKFSAASAAVLAPSRGTRRGAAVCGGDTQRLSASCWCSSSSLQPAVHLPARRQRRSRRRCFCDGGDKMHGMMLACKLESVSRGRVSRFGLHLLQAGLQRAAPGRQRAHMGQMVVPQPDDCGLLLGFQPGAVDYLQS